MFHSWRVWPARLGVSVVMDSGYEFDSFPPFDVVTSSKLLNLHYSSIPSCK